MPEISPQNHAAVLRTVRQLQADLRALRDSTGIEKGYMGFEFTEATLSGLHEAIAGSRDCGQIVSWLKKAEAAVTLTGGGAVAPAVDNIRKELKAMRDTLENPIG